MTLVWYRVAGILVMDFGLCTEYAWPADGTWISVLLVGINDISEGSYQAQ